MTLAVAPSHGDDEVSGLLHRVQQRCVELARLLDDHDELDDGHVLVIEALEEALRAVGRIARPRAQPGRSEGGRELAVLLTVLRAAADAARSCPPHDGVTGLLRAAAAVAGDLTGLSAGQDLTSASRAAGTGSPASKRSLVLVSSVEGQRRRNAASACA